VRPVLPAELALAAAVAGLAATAVVRPSPPVPALTAAALVLAAGCLLVPSPARRLAIVVAGVWLLGWAWGGLRLAALDRSALLPAVGTAGRLRVVVTGEARVGRFSQRVPARAIRFDQRPLRERVQLELASGRSPPQGAILSLLAVVKLPRGPDGGFDERTWLRRQGIHVVLHVDEWHVVGRRGGLGGAADRLRAWLRRSSAPGLTGERRAVLEGVVLGDDAGLDDDLKTSFRRSGLYHLLAVSGANVVLLAGGMLALAGACGLPRGWAHVAAIAAILAYVLAVGPQPSVIRAAVSGVAVSVAWLVSRERDPWHILLLAAAVLLAWSPYALFDPGFQLSFAAVAAIFLVVGPTLQVLEGYPVPRKLGAIVAISVACSAATAPILWLQFGQVPLLGVVANALVEPVVGALLGLALVTAVVAPVAPPLAVALAWLNGWIAAYTAGCARLVAAAPFAQARGRGAAVAAVCALGCGAYAWWRWRTSFSRPI
jgi:competence protein ComEC